MSRLLTSPSKKSDSRTPLLPIKESKPSVNSTVAENESVHGEIKVNPAESLKNSLGTLNGVFIPCSLNIMGIILFLRFGWSVGQAGVLGTIAILAVAEIMAVLTVLSFSAIVTNGNMAGGGSYFMISRSK